MSEKNCTNVACSMHLIKVRTDLDKCIGCSRELVDPLASLFGDLGGLFGRR